MEFIPLIAGVLRIALTEAQLAMADSRDERERFEQQLQVDRATFQADCRTYKDARAAANAAAGAYADKVEPAGGA